MNFSEPVQREIVLAGAGLSHLCVLKEIAKKRFKTPYRITMISDEISIPYSGMLSGFLTGNYSREELSIDLRKICNAAGVRLIHSEIEKIAPEENLVFPKGRVPIRYDLLFLNCGCLQKTESITGAEKHAVSVRPFTRFLNVYEQILQEITAYKISQIITFIGGNFSGIELLITVRRSILNELQKKNKIDLGLQFRIITSESEILAKESPHTQNTMKEYLRAKNIEVLTNQKVASIKKEKIVLKNGSELLSHRNFLCTGNAPDKRFSSCGFDTDEAGFLLVNQKLQTLKFLNVYVSGDISSVQGSQRTEGGVPALRQGQYLAKNLFRIFTEKNPLFNYYPQKKYLRIMNLGNCDALLCWKNFHYLGHFSWKFKNRIDTRYLKSFTNLYKKVGISAKNQLHQTGKTNLIKIPGPKISRAILYEVLKDAGFKDAGEKNSKSYFGETACLYTPGKQSFSLQSGEFLKNFLFDDFLFGQIATQHGLNNIFARGGEADFATAIFSFPNLNRQLLRNSLYQIIAGIIQELQPLKTKLTDIQLIEAKTAGVTLHFTGQVTKTALLNKKSIQKRNSLILTKSLGIGTLFRANARNQAKANQLEKACASMLQGHANVVEIFPSFSIKSCNTISNSGIAGSILEMLENNADTGFELEFENLPILEGVFETLKRDRFATTQKQKPYDFSNILIPQSLQKDPRLDVLFDPQVSGPLLICVPAEKVKNFTRNLREMGCKNVTVIGKFIEKEKNTSQTIFLK